MATWEDNRRIREAVYAHPAVKCANWGAGTRSSTRRHVPAPVRDSSAAASRRRDLGDWRGTDGACRRRPRPGDAAASAQRRRVRRRPRSTRGCSRAPWTQRRSRSPTAHVCLPASTKSRTGSPATSRRARRTVPLAFSRSLPSMPLPAQYRQLLDDVKEDVIAAQIQAYVDVRPPINLPMLKETLTRKSATRTPSWPHFRARSRQTRHRRLDRGQPGSLRRPRVWSRRHVSPPSARPIPRTRANPPCNAEWPLAGAVNDAFSHPARTRRPVARLSWRTD